MRCPPTEYTTTVQLSLKRLLLVCAALLLAVLAMMAPARALEVEFSARPVRREVLALYDSRHEKKPAETRLHRMAEMPVNWLGWKFVYVDINGALPSIDDLARYRGAVTWFVEPMLDPGRYLAWLDVATARGLRLACLAELAPAEPPGTAKLVERVFARLGLKPEDQFINVTHKAKITVQNAKMAGFERAIDKALPSFRVFQATAASTTVHLAASVPGEEQETNSVLIATSPAGGYVSDEFTIFYDAATDKTRWVVNPFLFFKMALGEERAPIPDVTTLAGRRIYFSHINGDGWNNVSEIEGFRDAHVSAADVIRREAIEPYSDLPVSIGLIAGDAQPDLGGLETARESAQKLYALPQVEVASHTYTHPFAWAFYENYDRSAELAMIDKAAHPALSLMDQMRGLLYRIAGRQEQASTHERYVAGSADLPRSYLKTPFNLANEINGALDVSQQLAPAGKKAAILLWSGDTEVFEAAIRQSRLAGVRNMNGGDTRFDAEFPSVFYVPPIARPVGAERQIYAANSNENTYTNNWHGPYYGQLMLHQTLKNTEVPRRLKPFNLYYHMYSGEKPGSLAAIKNILDTARSAPVIPVKASEYAAIADDFFNAEIAQVDALGWSILKRGATQTMRFDEADGLDVDYAKSSGVLGVSRHEGSMYVALDPAVEPASITLKPADTEPAALPKGTAHLVESRWQLKNFRAEACGFKISAQGFGPGEMVWMTSAGQAFDVVSERPGQQTYRNTIFSDGNGRLAVSLTLSALEPVELRFACHEN